MENGIRTRKTLKELNIPRVVKVQHSANFDKDYQEEARATRIMFHGQVGIITDMSNSHGLCFEIQFQMGNSWYDQVEPGLA